MDTEHPVLLLSVGFPTECMADGKSVMSTLRFLVWVFCALWLFSIKKLLWRPNSHQQKLPLT